ncbi:MAG: hypothetical protein AB7E79_04940 [Rhodospirillaceae bacterium]
MDDTAPTHSASANAPDIFDRTFLRSADDLSGLYLMMLKGGLSKHSRDEVGRATAHFVRNKLVRQIRSMKTPLDPDGTAIVKTLAKKGYTFIPDVFSAEDITEIKRFTQNRKVGISAYGNEAEVPFPEVPPDANFAHFHFLDFGGCAPIYRLVHDERLIRMMTHYLGAPPTIGIISLWWSYAPPGAPEGMQMFHHDRGDFRSCNLFTYLTDVDLGTGPHAYVERTHEVDILGPLTQERFASQPEMHQKFWQWMEQHRKTDEEVRRFFPESEIKFFTGRQGTTFLEDTRGLHKGTRPTTGPRLAFEIFFGVMPKYNEAITPLVRADLDLPPELNVPTDKLDPLVRYATRQFYV